MKQFFNRPLRILLVTNAMILMAGAMLGPIYAIFVTDIGGDIMDASIAGAIFALVAGLTTFVSGKYSDTVKESELIIVVGYVIMAIGFFAYIWVDSIAMLFIVQAIIGLGEAVYAPAFDAQYSKHLDKHKSGTEWGAWETTNYFTTAVGALFGGLLVTSFGFTPLFAIMGSLCLLSAVYILRLKRNVL